jgi:hypothetical protein
MVFKLFILIFLATVASINGFVPAKLITDVINKVDNKFQGIFSFKNLSFCYF